MDALIIRQPWLGLILSGKKTWEIRGSRTNKRGPIALIESGSADDDIGVRLDQIRTIGDGESGPWVDIVPARMLASLASIAAKDGEEFRSIAERWARIEEFEFWDGSEILDTLRNIGDTAETALLEDKTLLIWTSL